MHRRKKPKITKTANMKIKTSKYQATENRQGMRKIKKKNIHLTTP
jgi:hypothetical protein